MKFNNLWWKLGGTITKRDAENERDEQERYWEILVCLPQPASPHIRVSLPGEEEGCDQQAARSDLNNSGWSAPHLDLLHASQLASEYSAIAHVLWHTVHPVSLYSHVCLHEQVIVAVTTQALWAWSGIIVGEGGYGSGTHHSSSSGSRLNIIVCCFQNISWLLHRLHLRCVLWPTISLNHCHNAGVIQRNDCSVMLHAVEVWYFSASISMLNRRSSGTLRVALKFNLLSNTFPASSHHQVLTRQCFRTACLNSYMAAGNLYCVQCGADNSTIIYNTQNLNTCSSKLQQMTNQTACQFSATRAKLALCLVAFPGGAFLLFQRRKNKDHCENTHLLIWKAN